MNIFGSLLFFALATVTCERALENESSRIAPEAASFYDFCKDYAHRSDEELASMAAGDLIEEDVKEQMCHEFDSSDQYRFSVNNFLRRKGREAIPLIEKIITDYDPRGSSKIDGVRFSVAVGFLDDIDNRVLRVRGLGEGRSAIGALEKKLALTRSSGSQRNLGLLEGYLKSLKGSNLHDELIQNSLRNEYQIEINDIEMAKFSDYLTSKDISYPSWSEIPVNGPPTVLQDTRRYHEAYLKFNKKFSGTSN